MTLVLLIAAAIFGALHIRSDYRHEWPLTYIYKPLAMVAIIEGLCPCNNHYLTSKG